MQGWEAAAYPAAILSSIDLAFSPGNYSVAVVYIWNLEFIH